MPTLINNIGYTGKVTIADCIILATGGSVSIQHSPMFTSGIWGATWSNATDKIAYAPNYVTLSANVNYQLTDNIAQAIAPFAFDARDEGADCQIYPDNKSGFGGTMFCTGCGFSTSQDSLVTGDISFKGGFSSGSFSSGSVDSTDGSAITATLSEAASTYKSVYPYWGSNVCYQSTAVNSTRSGTTATTDVDDIIGWNASYSSDLIFAGVCYQASTMLDADYCALGMMDAQGSFTVIGISDKLSTSSIQSIGTVTISMIDAQGSNSHSINFKNVVWQDGSFDVQTGTSLVQSTMNFIALGNTTNAPMYFT